MCLDFIMAEMIYCVTVISMKKAVSRAVKITAGLVTYLAASACAYMPFVISDAAEEYDDDCDCLVVLGGDIIGADTPSPQLFERMKRAAEYLAAHPDTVAIPCGGCFRKNQKKSEAAIIADYLISRGIAPGRIILEDKSTTTFENFDNALKIINESFSGREMRIAFLSSSYHLFRASLIAKMCSMGEPGKVSAKTPGESFKRFAREYFVAYQLPYEYIKRKVAGKK